MEKILEKRFTSSSKKSNTMRNLKNFLKQLKSTVGYKKC